MSEEVKSVIPARIPCRNCGKRVVLIRIAGAKCCPKCGAVGGHR